MAKKTAFIFLSKKLLVYLFLTGMLVISILIALFLFLSNRYYPAVSVANLNLFGLTPNESQAKINNNLLVRAKKTLSFSYSASSTSAQPQSFTISLEDNFTPETEGVLNEAFTFGHQRFYLTPQNLKVKINFSDKLQTQIDQIKDQVNKEALDSRISIDENKEIVVSPSLEGEVLDEEKLKTILVDYLNTGTQPINSLPMEVSKPKLSYQSALLIKKRLDQIKLTPLKLTFEDQSFNLDLPTVLSFIDQNNSQISLASATLFDQVIQLNSISLGNQEITDSTIAFNKEALNKYLATIASQIDQPVQEPLFQFNPNSPQRIEQFRPPQEGRKLNTEQSASKIITNILHSDKTSLELVVDIQKPDNKLVNDLGIYELIGEGVSNFAHSIENRIYNVNLAAQKINGTIISPGQTFSFNQTMGDITAATGFKPAYVIKSGRTVLDDGGGVCQVSTTLFRAALNSGLPIVERTAHAYRVSYYEQGSPPGIDATTFYPTVDLKFKNDTPASILIQTRVEGTRLTISFYGTKDGRVATISTPKIVSQTPALPELRQDDPTLPKGQVKQVDFAAAGANVVFSRTVTKDGQVLINETFRSNYRPWQAVFLVGTKEG